MEVVLLEQVHQVVQKQDSDGLSHLNPVFVRALSDEGHPFDQHHADTLVSDLLEHLVERVSSPSFDEVGVPLGMAYIGSGLLELVEVVLEEVNVALVVVYQEAQDVEVADDALEVRFLARSQSYRVETVLVDYLNSVQDLGIDVEVDQLAFVSVVALAILELPLNPQPVLDSDLLKDPKDELKAAHLRKT